jgi:hypothetical protein
MFQFITNFTSSFVFQFTLLYQTIINFAFGCGSIASELSDLLESRKSNKLELISTVLQKADDFISTYYPDTSSVAHGIKINHKIIITKSILRGVQSSIKDYNARLLSISEPIDDFELVQSDSEAEKEFIEKSKQPKQFEFKLIEDYADQKGIELENELNALVETESQDFVLIGSEVQTLEMILQEFVLIGN